MNERVPTTTDVALTTAEWAEVTSVLKTNRYEGKLDGETRRVPADQVEAVRDGVVRAVRMIEGCEWKRLPAKEPLMTALKKLGGKPDRPKELLNRFRRRR